MRQIDYFHIPYALIKQLANENLSLGLVKYTDIDLLFVVNSINLRYQRGCAKKVHNVMMFTFLILIENCLLATV